MTMIEYEQYSADCITKVQMLGAIGMMKLDELKKHPEMDALNRAHLMYEVRETLKESERIRKEHDLITNLFKVELLLKGLSREGAE